VQSENGFLTARQPLCVKLFMIVIEDLSLCVLVITMFAVTVIHCVKFVLHALKE